MQRIQQRARQEEKPVTVVGVNAHRGCVRLLRLVEQWLCTSAVTYVANCVKQSPQTQICIDDTVEAHSLMHITCMCIAHQKISLCALTVIALMYTHM